MSIHFYNNFKISGTVSGSFKTNKIKKKKSPPELIGWDSSGGGGDVSVNTVLEVNPPKEENVGVATGNIHSNLNGNILSDMQIVQSNKTYDEKITTGVYSIMMVSSADKEEIMDECQKISQDTGTTLLDTLKQVEVKTIYTGKLPWRV